MKHYFFHKPNNREFRKETQKMYMKRKSTGFTQSIHPHFRETCVLLTDPICCVRQACNVILKMCSCVFEECFIKTAISGVLVLKCAML